MISIALVVVPLLLALLNATVLPAKMARPRDRRCAASGAGSEGFARSQPAAPSAASASGHARRAVRARCFSALIAFSVALLGLASHS